MRRSSAKMVTILAGVLPYAFLLGSMGVFLLLLLLRRSDLAFKSLYLLIPISIAAFIVIIRPAWFKVDSITAPLRRSLSPQAFQNIVLLNIFLNIISICLLFLNNTNLLGYFIIVGLIASLIFVEIMLYGGDEHPGRKGIILFQIAFVSANVIFGQTLRLPLFFGYGDVLAHMYNISTIVETGRITSSMLYDYQYFPAFHIFGALGNIMSGLKLETSYFIFSSLVFLISIPVIYLLVSRLTKNAYLPLLAALLYALSREVIFNGMYMITRVMAFVLCFMILYLLIRSKGNLKIRALAVSLVFPLVTVHHTTLLQFSGILFIIVVIEFMLYQRKNYIGFNFLVLFIVAYLGYWVWISYPFFKNTVVSYSAAQEIAQIPGQDTRSPLFLIFTNNADAIVIAFLAIFGIISMLRARRESFVMWTAFTIFSIAALIIYFPAISSFLSQALLSGRLQLLVTPFIAFVSAGGLFLIVRKSLTVQPRWEFITRIGVGMIVVFFLSLSSMAILGNTTDFSLQKILGSENRQYYTKSELAAFSFAKEYGPNILYFGDYASNIYLLKRLGLSVRQTNGVFEPDTLERGFFVFRKQELETRGRLAFNIWTEAGPVDQEFTYHNSGAPGIQALWEKENKIFDGGTVYIYMKKMLE